MSNEEQEFADRSIECKTAAFIDEYEALCKKYNLIVRSCDGCCGIWVDSPPDPSDAMYDERFTIQGNIAELKG